MTVTIPKGAPRPARGGDALARLLLPLGVAVIVAVSAACGAPPPTPSSVIGGLPSPSTRAQPDGPAVLGIDWMRAASVERPVNFEESVSPSYPGTHPILRIAGQAMMTDVVALPGGGFTAVGYLPPDWTPASWTSSDGETWSIHSLGTTDFTFPVALAAGRDRTVVAVGRSRNEPVAWTTTDGASWVRHAVPVLGRGAIAERMTTVVAGPNGFVAGGSVGPELADRHARFWTSTNGADWVPVPDDANTFANSEVRAITRFGAGFVAVGVVGTAQQHTGAVAWTSPDGVRWTRADAPSFVDGVAVAVVAAPFGGVVAVGSDADRREAVAWTSRDGRAWTRAPSEHSRQYAGYVWMTDVEVVGDVVIGIGEYQGLQRGTATSWVSRDGMSWERARTAPVQEQGEFYAITPGGPGAIVVGSFGAPDSYVPTVWLTPGR